jgi:hypothetical protein
MKESTPSMSFGVRSSDLKAVDQALLNYWSDQSETRLVALRKALLFWEEKKSHYEQAGNSLYRRPTRDWRQDIRNSKGVVSLLHDALFASTRPFSPAELEGLEMLRAASLDPVKNLLRGKQISVKKTAIASLISSAYKGGCTEFCVNGLMAGNRRTSRSGYDLKHKESSTQRSH